MLTHTHTHIEKKNSNLKKVYIDTNRKKAQITVCERARIEKGKKKSVCLDSYRKSKLIIVDKKKEKKKHRKREHFFFL